MRKILLALALLLSPVAAFGQGSVLGQETVVTYTGTNAQLTQANTPASAFQSPNGTNTFILSIPPQSAIRLFITNNSATPCPAGFTVQMFAASDAQVNSFNNQLSN